MKKSMDEETNEKCSQCEEYEERIKELEGQLEDFKTSMEEIYEISKKY